MLLLSAFAPSWSMTSVQRRAQHTIYIYYVYIFIYVFIYKHLYFLPNIRIYMYTYILTPTIH